MKRPNTQTRYIGKCIYCPNDGVTDEHIVPIAFGGHHVLREASCAECQKHTSAIETLLCVQNFDAVRFHHNYAGRRRTAPGKRSPDMKVMTTGGTPLEPKFQKVGADLAPGVTLFPVFAPAGLLVGGKPTDPPRPVGLHFFDTSDDGAERQRALIESGIERSLAYAQIDTRAFAVLLAKIAHGYAVFNVGLEAFRPLLPPLISGEDPALFHFVGGNYSPPMPECGPPADGRPYQIHVLQCENGGQQYLGAQIRLFATVRPLTPVYTVIFGQPL